MDFLIEFQFCSNGVVGFLFPTILKIQMVTFPHFFFTFATFLIYAGVFYFYHSKGQTAKRQFLSPEGANEGSYISPEGASEGRHITRNREGAIIIMRAETPSEANFWQWTNTIGSTSVNVYSRILLKSV